MPKVSGDADYVGDRYPVVRSWMVRLGTRDLDAKARVTFMKDRAAILTYIHAICGPRLPVSFRKLRAYAGRGWYKGITLDRGMVDGGRMTLGTVLHECAHVLVSRRDLDRLKVRRELRAEGKPSRTTYKRTPPHGGEFCRVYARLLREVMQ